MRQDKPEELVELARRSKQPASLANGHAVVHEHVRRPNTEGDAECKRKKGDPNVVDEHCGRELRRRLA